MRRDRFVAAYLDALRPPPAYDPASWADARRVLTTAETPEPGPWVTDKFPPSREPMERLALHDATQRVVLMFAAQMVKSEIANNLIGYVVDHSPCPVMMLRPTIDDAEGFSKQRLKHLFACEALRDKVKEARSRDSGNTLLLKEFPGGILILAGANAPARLASWPVRVLIADEIDRFPRSAGTEGSPLMLARARMSAFGLRAKELDTSTPTVKGRSAIETEYEASSMARYAVPCPNCGEHLVLSWPMLKWAGDPEVEKGFDVWIECPSCNGRIEEHEKAALLAGGEWVHEHPDRLVKGYHINALYAPAGRISWRMLVAEWVRANDRAKIGDTTLLQVFVNTRLAETWEDRGERVDAGTLEGRDQEGVPYPLPANIRVLTFGGDVQDDRIEGEVVGWGPGNESWSVGYYVIPTDPLDRQTWTDLDAILTREWERADGQRMRVAAACIDTGYRTQTVLDFVRGRARRRVFAIKGVPGHGKPIWDKKVRKAGKDKRGGVFHAVGVDTAKDAVSAYLRITQPGPGYCHFPTDRTQKIPDYFKQLTAEKRIKVKDRRGRESWEWRLIIEGSRNEALDCRVYALAALHALQIAGLRMDPAPVRASEFVSDATEPPVPGAVDSTEPAPERQPTFTVPENAPHPNPRGTKPRPKRGDWLTGRGPRGGRWL